MTILKTSKFQTPIISLVLILSFWLISMNTYAQLANPDTDTVSTQEKLKIQIALILDTSGSMEGLIEQAKTQLWSLVDELTKATYEGQDPELEIGYTI